MARVRFFIFIQALALCFSLTAKEISGRVTAVYDGDTIKIRAEGIDYMIRLHGIDAPESGQAFGGVSRRMLNKIVYNRNVRIEYDEQDYYGRMVGTVYKGKTNVNLEMVKLGLAWVYKKYNEDKTGQYARAEKEAKENKTGMWKYTDNIPPWEWRKTNFRKTNSKK